ncbi:Nuclear receptor domain-containing protein [Aphelenchoides fujianensis]|nr:Nuclear receptor domain-containing protein [Aphelenchoides fujianensis]
MTSLQDHIHPHETGHGSPGQISLISSGADSPLAYRECPVCGGVASHSHFGGIPSCNVCAAFFRRTVVEQKSYQCRRNLKCLVKKEKNKRGCQRCRWERCLKIGMTVDAVLSKPTSSVKYDAFADDALAFLLKCRRSTFIIRGQATVDVYGGPEKYCNMTDRVKTAASCQKAIRAESYVLYEFIRLMEVADEDEHEFTNTLVESFLQPWLSCESVYNTWRHRGFFNRRCYCFDDSFLVPNEDAISEYFHSYGSFKDAFFLARLCYKLFAKIVETGQHMYNNRISDTEFTAIQFIFLLQTAIRLHPKPERYRQRLNSLFKALEKHYKDNYEDVGMKLGNLILSMQYLQELFGVEEEIHTYRRLNAIHPDN